MTFKGSGKYGSCPSKLGLQQPGDRGVPYEYFEICAVCGWAYGAHFGDRCPTDAEMRLRGASK